MALPGPLAKRCLFRSGKRVECAPRHGCRDGAIYPGVYLDLVTPDAAGYVHAPTKPGLGFEIDFAAAEKVTEQTIEA